MQKLRKNLLLLLTVLLITTMTSCVSKKKVEKEIILPPRPQRHELPKLTGNETDLEMIQLYATVLNLYNSDMDEWELYADTVESFLE